MQIKITALRWNSRTVFQLGRLSLPLRVCFRGQKSHCCFYKFLQKILFFKLLKDTNEEANIVLIYPNFDENTLICKISRVCIFVLCNTLFFKTEFLSELSLVQTENPEAGSISVEFVRHIDLRQCGCFLGVPVKCKIIQFTWFREQHIQGFPARFHLMLSAHLTIFKLQHHRKHT